MADSQFRVVGIRADGSHRVLIAGVSRPTADIIKSQVEIGIFAVSAHWLRGSQSEDSPVFQQAREAPGV